MSNSRHSYGGGKTFLTAVEEKYEDENAFQKSNDSEDDVGSELSDKDLGKSIVNDIMMVLDMDKVHELQYEFQKAQNGLTIYEFIFVMSKFLDMAIKKQRRCYQ